MLGRIGVLGFLGIIVFVAWAIGWIFFNFMRAITTSCSSPPSC